MRPNSPFRLLLFVFLGLVLLASVGMRTAWYGTGRFEQAYPDFVKQNLWFRERLRKRPRTLHRDQALAAIEANLRWAKRYEQTGVDPEFLDDLAHGPEPVVDDAAR